MLFQAGFRHEGSNQARKAAEDPALDLALRIDEAVKSTRPDGWRGVQAREQVIKAALYYILKDEAEVERIFLIVKQQREY